MSDPTFDCITNGVSIVVVILRTELKSYEELLTIVRTSDGFIAGQAVQLFRHLALPSSHSTRHFTEGMFDLALHIVISLEDSNYDVQMAGLKLLSVMTDIGE
jgi:hypothetical protein